MSKRWQGSWAGGRTSDPLVTTIVHQGEPVATLTVTKPANDPLTPAERGLLEDLGAQAGLAVHNVRLTEELAIRLRELDVQAAALRVSRERLVTARDAQRRGLQRDIQEGPERQLLDIGRALDTVTEPAQLDPLIERANDTLDGLRDLARGVFPPLLADQGIVPALEAHIRKVGARTTVDAPALAGRRFDADVEACAYFCCLQAIQNVLRHAGNAPSRVQLGLDGEELTFEMPTTGRASMWHAHRAAWACRSSRTGSTPSRARSRSGATRREPRSRAASRRRPTIRTGCSVTARRIAIGVIAVTVVLFIARYVLAVSTGSLSDQSGLAFNLIYGVGVVLFCALFVFVGWSIVTRRPRNAIAGPVGDPLIGGLALFCGDYATQALKVDPGSLPFGTAAAWVDRWLIVVVLCSFIPLFLLFPDGRLPSRRWRPVLWVSIGAPIFTLIAFALTPDRRPARSPISPASA